MSFPCHEGPPATAGHLCSEPAVAGGGRYYCIMFTIIFCENITKNIFECMCLLFGYLRLDAVDSVIN